MSIKKHEINKYLEKNHKRLFVWGEFDCHIFVMELLEIVYPDNTLPKLQALYSNEAQAIDIQRQYSWHTELAKAFDIEYIKDLYLESTDTTNNIILCLYEYNGFECIHLVWEGRLISPVCDDVLRYFPVKILSFLSNNHSFIRIIQPKTLCWQENP